MSTWIFGKCIEYILFAKCDIMTILLYHHSIIIMNNHINELMDNSNNNYILSKYKHMISGFRTIEDCYLILEKCIFDESDKLILLHLINCKRTEKCFNYITMKSILKELNEIKYKEDVYEYVSSVINKTENIAQIKTITRIMNGKPSRPYRDNYINDSEISDYIDRKIEKKCPHCCHINIAPTSTEYIICGYGENGYDWEGCGKDWCFKCGKILCRSWDVDMLFIEENRLHNGECCKHHSNINNKKYPEDYCHCSSSHIKK